MIRKAIITGIAGQDGSYLTELLLEKGYEIHGIIRRHSVKETEISRLSKYVDINKINLHYGDITDPTNILSIIKAVKPDEFYNLAAQSDVRISFDCPLYTRQVNADAVYNLLEIIRIESPTTKFYQASTSELYGNSIGENGFQYEDTKMLPVSPYSISKLTAHNLIRNYREQGMFASAGILFNHESPRRGESFITAKVVNGVVDIYKGKKEYIELGNLNSGRDWGHAKDYVRAMYLIMHYEKPADWVIATGKTRTVRELCEITFSYFNLDYKKYVKINPKFFRPVDIHVLKGDSKKARSLLNWEPTYTFESMIEEMIKVRLNN